MRESRFFVRSSDLAGRRIVRFAGNPAVSSYGSIIERVYELAGADAAALFAEPVLPRGASGELPAISWYSTREGNVAEFDSLDEFAQKPLTQALRERLAALKPALDDPEIGPALASWVNISSTRDILAVGGEPVIVNWGFLPEALPENADAENAHYSKTLGRFAANLDPPPAAASRPAINPVAVPAAAATGATISARVINSTEQKGGASPEKTPEAPRVDRPWRAPLIAAALAGLLLLLLLLPGVLRYPDYEDTRPRDAFETERLKQSNESLETQLRTLQGAGGNNLCRARNGDLVPLPGLGRGSNQSQVVPEPMELVPRAPDRLPVSPSDSNAHAENVQDLLEKSTVLVVALDASGKHDKQGSGFFIDDRHIVTNHHVVLGSENGAVFIASRALGGIRRARIAAKSEPPPDERDVRVDLAVLEIEPSPGHASLKLGAAPPKLSTAYVAGFPGFLIQHDADFAKFVAELGASLKSGESSDSLARKQLAVPGADMRYGRINNIMNSGERELPIIIHDMQLAPGNSGGPLVDACGRLGGVNTSLFKNAQQVQPAGGPPAQDPGGGQQANVAQDVSLLKSFLTSNQVSFSEDTSPCQPAVARNDPPTPPPAGGPANTAPPPPGAPAPAGK